MFFGSTHPFLFEQLRPSGCCFSGVLQVAGDAAISRRGWLRRCQWWSGRKPRAVCFNLQRGSQIFLRQKHRQNKKWSGFQSNHGGGGGAAWRCHLARRADVSVEKLGFLTSKWQNLTFVWGKVIQLCGICCEVGNFYRFCMVLLDILGNFWTFNIRGAVQEKILTASYCHDLTWLKSNQLWFQLYIYTGISKNVCKLCRLPQFDLEFHFFTISTYVFINKNAFFTSEKNKTNTSLNPFFLKLRTTMLCCDWDLWISCFTLLMCLALWPPSHHWWAAKRRKPMPQGERSSEADHWSGKRNRNQTILRYIFRM